MNVRELREELSKYPDDHIVCIDNMEILSVEPKPAYWDGTLNKIILDEKGRIEGIKLTSKGNKLEIRCRDLDDIFLDNPDVLVIYEGLNDWKINEYRERIERLREESREIIQEIEEEMPQKGK